MRHGWRDGFETLLQRERDELYAGTIALDADTQVTSSCLTSAPTLSTSIP